MIGRMLSHYEILDELGKEAWGVVYRARDKKFGRDVAIKVLDFGLARAFSNEAVDVNSSLSPTLTRDAHRAGVIMGTAAYMSPEL